MGALQGAVSPLGPFAPAMSGVPGKQGAISGIVSDDTRQGGQFRHGPVTGNGRCGPKPEHQAGQGPNELGQDLLFS